MNNTQKIFKFMWLNPFVISILTILIILTSYKIYKLFSDTKSIKSKKIIILIIIDFMLLAIIMLFGFSHTPMEYPILFGSPDYYYIIAN